VLCRQLLPHRDYGRVARYSEEIAELEQQRRSASDVIPKARSGYRASARFKMGSMRNLSWIFLLISHLALAQTSIPSLKVEQWSQDLEYFVNEIGTKHRDPYHFTSKAEFDRAVTSLRQRIGSMKDYEVVVGLQHLAALVGDGHTFLDTSDLYTRFPLDVFWFGDDLRVIGGAPEYRQALGARVIAIGSLSIREVQSRLQQIISQGENRWCVLNSSAEQIMKAEPLAALGVLPHPGPADFTFEDDSGHRFRLRIRPVAGGKGDSAGQPEGSRPLPFLHAGDPFWFTYLPDTGTVYVDFRSYRDLENQAAHLWEFIAHNPVKRLVIDMRWNGGGNYTKGREFLIYKVAFMPTLNRAGHLFVITGRKTFSAGMTNVTHFRRETEAILVGEPTGARPNGYQENHWFTLPHSKLRASCATLKYRFQPLAKTEAVIPDQLIDPDWRSFSAGQDSALAWILAQP